MKLLRNITYLALVSSMFIGCAKQNAFFLAQGYHDITSHYNSYFNANEAYKLAIKSLEETRKDNYDEIIPIYAYGTLEDTKAQETAFSTVIDKSTRSIQLHKKSNWSDDNFLLLGKAFYMQGEYDKSIESLRYITANYKEGVDGRSDKKKKKDKRNKKKKAKAKKLAKKKLEKLKDGKDIRPKKSLLVHEPTKTEALIWMVKGFTAKKEYTNAAAVLDYIESDYTFIQNYDRDKEKVYAHYLIEQKQYGDAILHLENAISMYKSNKKKSRLRFVLAQLYETTGNKKDAIKYFNESTKGNTNYEMEFNAKLKAIKLSNGGNSDKVDKLLAKLIKDSKNEAYLDQLYYQRALIALNNKDEENAIAYLDKSIEFSKENNKQKAKSFLLLAEISYDNEDYLTSQENYAACLSLLDPENENYKTVSKRAIVLTELVNQLNTINKNDSLLKIAELPQDKIEALLYQQAVDMVDAEMKASESNGIVDKFAGNDKLNKSAKWYFYSENTKTIGYARFKQTWGDRKLEDNWRRENKSTSSDLAEEPKTEEEVYEEKVNTLYESLLAEIPNSDATKSKYNDDIAFAHYTAANIYKYDLENDEKAIKHFKAITKKFSQSKYDAESHFNLYLLNKKIEHIAASNKSKNMVLSKYPKSKYAKIIKDPNYADQSESEDDLVEKYYEDTYKKFIAEDFTTVISRVSESKTKYPSNKYEAKFALLEAITLGKQKKYQPYVSSLENVISTYKDTEEEEKASELLAYLKGDYTKKESHTATDKQADKEKEQKEEKSNSIFDPNRDKDKEGLKINFGKKEIISVGTSKTDKDSKTLEIDPFKKKEPKSSTTDKKEPFKKGE